MSVIAWMSIVASLGIARCELRPEERIIVRSPEVTIGDVMDVTCLDPARRQEMASLTIARIPDRQAVVELSRAALKSLVHRRAPGIAFAPAVSNEGTVTIAIRTPLAPSREESSCVRASQMIERGQVLIANILERTTCSSESAARSAISFDRMHGVLRATRPIAAGETLGRLDAPQAALLAGEKLNLQIAIGPIQIERSVVSIQAATGGSRVFVQADDGTIFAAPTATPERKGQAE